MPVPQKHSEWRRVVYEVMEITWARFFRSANISVKSPKVSILGFATHSLCCQQLISTYVVPKQP